MNNHGKKSCSSGVWQVEKGGTHDIKKEKSSYDTIIQEARVKYDLHMKSDHKLCIAHPGLSLSMKKVEGFLLEMMLHLGNMQAPVMCREGLELANSLWLEELQHKKKS